MKNGDGILFLPAAGAGIAADEFIPASSAQGLYSVNTGGEYLAKSTAVFHNDRGFSFSS